MFLAIDVGNSNIMLGIYHKGRWKEVWRVETRINKSKDDYEAYYGTMFERAEIPPGNIMQVMIASVVPNVTEHLADAMKVLTGIEPLVLTPDVKIGISLETDNPHEIGADLIAGAVGGYSLFRDTCIVVDFGTATTLMAVKKPGILTGGVICAGLKITADALVTKAALLGDIPLEPPKHVLAKGTVEAMQSGLVLGHVCMVEGLISRMKQELDSAKVVATGGLTETLSPHTDCFDIVEPLLTLEGMRNISGRQ